MRWHSVSGEPLTQDRVRSLLIYNGETGQFIRRVSTAPRAVAGSVAGDVDSKGYWRLRVDGRRYLAHRLVWFYVHGVWPKDEIDHINGIRTDNRIENLREASRFENKRNTGAHCDSRSRHKGVSFHAPSKRWRARIHMNGEEHWIGVFDTPEDAAAAYRDVSAEHFGEFSRAK